MEPVAGNPLGGFYEGGQAQAVSTARPVPTRQLTTVEAREIASEVGRAVSKWREEAALRGMSMAETDRMASAFVHRDMEMALSR